MLKPEELELEEEDLELEGIEIEELGSQRHSRLDERLVDDEPEELEMDEQGFDE